MKLFLKILFSIFIGFIALVIVFGALTVTVNNLTAKGISDELKRLPLPPNTTLVDSTSKAGKLCGNGNGMQYIGAVLLKSELSADELNLYYSKYRKNNYDCIITSANDPIIEHGKLTFSSAQNTDNCYIVYSWGDGIPLFCELDLRGH